MNYRRHNENNENVILCLFACLHETIDGYFFSLLEQVIKECIFKVQHG
jgi:hypothetical protein